MTAVATLNWRTFNFFESEIVKASKELEDLEITAATCARNHVYLGDAVGTVRIVERSNMNVQQTFPAYTGAVTHLRMPRQRSVLVSVGDDSQNDTAIIRVWDLEGRRGDNTVRPAREIRVFTARHPSPIPQPLRLNLNPNVKLTFRGGTSDTTFGTSDSVLSPVVCLDVMEDLQHIALGLADSRILMIRGEIDREGRPLKINSLTTKHADGKLTFVGFPRLKETPPPNSAFHALMYAVYEDVTVAFPLPPRNRDLSSGVDDRPFLLPQRAGAGMDCSALTDDGELVIINKEGVTFYGGEQFVRDKARHWDGAFSALDKPTPAMERGEKCKLAIHKHYLVVVTRPDATKKPDKFSLGIFDREARIKALTTTIGTLTNPAWILADVSDVLVISQQDAKSDQAKNKAVKLQEKTTQSKFDLLFKKDMYDEAKQIARQLAASGNSDVSSYNIERRYGDHLYDKGKYNEAVTQYIEAIKTTEPSYVIRKFLGEQRIGNLTEYLTALHMEKHGRLANKNHTTLLLNCYAKLKQRDELRKFILDPKNTFDAVNAIHVCRQAGYYDEAKILAKNYQKPDEYVMILLENLSDYQGALLFIKERPLREAERILRLHAKKLVANPATTDEATKLLIDLCTNWRNGAGDGRHARPEPFMPAFVDTPKALLRFLESIVGSTFRRSTSAPISVGNFDSTNAEVLGTLLELYLTPHLPDRVQHRVDGTNAEIKTSDPTSEDGGQEPKAAHTAPKERLEKAFELLQAFPGQYDPYHALMLVQQHNFERGVIYMLQSLNLHSEVFVYYTKQFESGATAQQRANAKAELLKTCEESQAKNPGEATRDMWVSYLSLLVRSKDEVEEDITTVLSRIEQLDLLPPVAVIEILSASEKLQLRAVRSFVINMIKRDREVIDACQEEIQDMTHAARQLEADVRSLQTTAQVFQTNKCNQCERPLDGSAVVYFLCNHSFHESCVSERDCNICGPQHRQHLQTQRDNDIAAADQNVFFNQLRDAGDGFAVIADYFGKGVFSSKKARAAGDLDEFDLDDDDDDDLYDASPDEIADLETF